MRYIRSVMVVKSAKRAGINIPSEFNSVLKNEDSRLTFHQEKSVEERLKEAVDLVEILYEECVDKELSDKELEKLVEKYPNGLERISLITRRFLQSEGRI